MDKPMSFCVVMNSLEVVTLTKNEQSSLLAIAIINSGLAFPTAALNVLIIVAILSTPSLRKPSYLLLASLGATDFIMGFLGQPLHSAMVLYYRKEDLETYCYIRSISSAVLVAAATASIMTITAIAVDRYLAIRLKMQYRSVVTLQRVQCSLVAIWAVSILVSSLQFYVSMTPVGMFGACGVALCLLVTVICYVMSFKTLKQHCAQIQPQAGEQQPNGNPQANAQSIDIVKYKKLLKTMLIILIFIVICFSVLAIFAYLISLRNQRRSILWALMSIVGLNSTFNPVIYLTRMRDLRQACRQILRKGLRLGGNDVHPSENEIPPATNQREVIPTTVTA